jgi:hypothetical protein
MTNGGQRVELSLRERPALYEAGQGTGPTID